MGDFVALALTVLAGVGVGILSGLFGIGGGTVIVPLLRLAFGVSITTATATSLFTIVPTSISGLIKHYRNKTVNLRFGLLLGVAGACISPVGVYLNTISPDLLVTLIAAAVIVFSAVRMLVKKHALSIETDACTLDAISADDERLKSDADITDEPAPAVTDNPSFEDNTRVVFNRRTVVTAVGIGAIAGLLSGYVGVGGGFIMVPLMVSLMRFPMCSAAGTSLVAVALLAIPGTITQALYGNIAYGYGLALMVGSIPGAQIGGWLITKVNDTALQRAFGYLLIVVGIVLVVNGLL